MLDKKISATPKGKHSQNQPNSNITKETRQEAYVVRPVTRAKDVLEVLGEDELTAREIAQRLGTNDRQYVAPRITELKNAGLIEAVGKRKDTITGINVAVWKKVEVQI